MAEDTMDVYNPNATDKEKAWFNAFRRYLVPLLGVGEAIASQGQSPGTAAMNVERNFQNQEDRRRQMLKEEEDRKEAALERAYKQSQREREKAAQESMGPTLDLMRPTTVYPDEPSTMAIPPTVKETDIGTRPFTGDYTTPEKKSQDILSQFNSAVKSSMSGGITPATKPEFTEEAITAPTPVARPTPVATPLKGIKQEGLSALDALIKSGGAQYADQDVISKFLTLYGNRAKGNSATAIRMSSATESDRAAARAVIDARIADGSLSEDMAPAYRSLAERDPLLINAAFSTKDFARIIAEQQYGELTPMAEDRSYLTSRAGKTGATSGVERVSDKVVDGLTGIEESVDILDIGLKEFNEDYTGPLKGRWGSFKEKVGVIGANEAVFRGVAQRFINALLKARSGTAVTENEFERMKTEALDFNLQPEAYVARMRSNMYLLKQNYNRILRSQQRTGRDVSLFNPYNLEGVSISPKKKNSGSNAKPKFKIISAE